MSQQQKRPVIIWTPAGSWYQQTVDERLVSSFLGWVKDKEELRRFCDTRDIEFVIYERELARV